MHEALDDAREEAGALGLLAPAHHTHARNLNLPAYSCACHAARGTGLCCACHAARGILAI
eukprot:14201384-Heterocapsa_arctica.AAC.2